MQFVTTHTWSGTLFGGALVSVPAGSVYDDAYVDVGAMRSSGVPLVPLTPALESALAAFRAQAGQGKPLPPDLAAFLAASAGVYGSVFVEPAAARVLAPADNGTTIRCTNVGGCAVTVPDTLPAGFSCILVQSAAGAVSLVAGPTYEFPISAVSPPTTAEQGSTLGLTVTGANAVLVYGSLA